MSTDISQKIDQLANFQAQRDVLELEKQSLIDQLIPPEIKARIEEIEAEFSGKREIVDEKITALESEIKEEVIRQRRHSQRHFPARGVPYRPRHLGHEIAGWLCSFPARDSRVSQAGRAICEYPEGIGNKNNPL